MQITAGINEDLVVQLRQPGVFYGEKSDGPNRTSDPFDELTIAATETYVLPNDVEIVAIKTFAAGSRGATGFARRAVPSETVSPGDGGN